MAVYRPTMVFTHVQAKSQNNQLLDQNENLSNDNAQKPEFHSFKDRSIQVTAVGEVTLQPDKCKVTITVNALKLDAQDAKNSVTRRVEYIQQCLHNYGLKSNDINSFNRLTRDSKMYAMRCEITAVFSDVMKCQVFSNLIVEKLDQNVEVSLPEFYHENKSIESLRKQASLLAVHNAKLKAQDMAKFVHLEVGRPVNIHEEELNEATPPAELSSSVHQRKLDAALTVSSKVSVQFELKKKKKII